MKKARLYRNYMDTVKENSDFFKSYYYHSIVDLNLVKLDLILSNGILSKNLLFSGSLPTLFTHHGDDYDSKNGYKYVSLTEYTDKCEFCSMFESFAWHTLTSLSVLVNKNIEVTREGERQTFFDDEVFCLNSIAPENIEGIILPENLSNMQISEVNCLPTDLSCYTKKYISNWINCMERYFNQSLPREEIMANLDQLWTVFRDYESPEKWVESAVETQRMKYGKDFKDVLAENLQILWSRKLKMDNPNYMDVILKINNDKLPVYEIKQKSLKRII